MFETLYAEALAHGLSILIFLCASGVFCGKMHVAMEESRGIALLKSPRHMLGIFSSMLMAGGAIGIAYTAFSSPPQVWEFLLLLGTAARIVYLEWSRGHGEKVL